MTRPVLKKTPHSHDVCAAVFKKRTRGVVFTVLLGTKSREFSLGAITVGMPHISEAVVTTHIKPITIR